MTDDPFVERNGVGELQPDPRNGSDQSPVETNVFERYLEHTPQNPPQERTQEQEPPRLERSGE